MKQLKLSVITPSIRPDGLKVTKECLENQTYQNFEWLPRLSVHRTGKSDLCYQYNQALYEATGDIFVSLQDWIWIPNDALEKIAKIYENPLLWDRAYSFPVGKVDDLKGQEEPRWDWRDCFSQKEMAYSWNWEIDFAACPLSAIKDAGYFDLTYDAVGAIGSENCDLAYRMEKLNMKFFTSNTTHGIAWDHDKYEVNPKKGLHQQANFDHWNQKRTRIDLNSVPDL
jgi:hypothetical protein